MADLHTTPPSPSTHTPQQTAQRARSRSRATAPSTQPPQSPAVNLLRLPEVAAGYDARGDIRAPGVYFGLAEGVYHADASLGSTDLKSLIRGPADFWHRSKLNPHRQPDTDTPSKAWGRAFHKLVLEGPEAFAERYTTEPDPAAYPGALVSLDHLKAYAKELGEAVSGTKAELTARIRQHDSERIIWDEVLARFKAAVEAKNLDVLKPAVRAEIEGAAQAITRNPHLANAFSGGVPEVSVFWRENGVPMKARLDYLKPAVFLDLKRCANQNEDPFHTAALKAIGRYRYDVQVAHYLDAWAQLIDFGRKGLVFGDCPLPDNWPEFMAEADAARAVLVFHQATGAPVTQAFELAAKSTALTRARREIAIAKTTFLAALDRYGCEPWIADTPIQALEDRDLPVWMRDITRAMTPTTSDAGDDDSVEAAS